MTIEKLAIGMEAEQLKRRLHSLLTRMQAVTQEKDLIAIATEIACIQKQLAFDGGRSMKGLTLKEFVRSLSDEQLKILYAIYSANVDEIFFSLVVGEIGDRSLQAREAGDR